MFSIVSCFLNNPEFIFVFQLQRLHLRIRPNGRRKKLHDDGPAGAGRGRYHPPGLCELSSPPPPRFHFPFLSSLSPLSPPLPSTGHLKKYTHTQAHFPPSSCAVTCSVGSKPRRTPTPASPWRLVLREKSRLAISISLFCWVRKKTRGKSKLTRHCCLPLPCGGRRLSRHVFRWATWRFTAKRSAISSIPRTRTSPWKCAITISWDLTWRTCPNWSSGLTPTSCSWWRKAIKRGRIGGLFCSYNTHWLSRRILEEEGGGVSRRILEEEGGGWVEGFQNKSKGLILIRRIHKYADNLRFNRCIYILGLTLTVPLVFLSSETVQKVIRTWRSQQFREKTVFEMVVSLLIDCLISTINKNQ